jgi:hypothetical protein
MTSFAFLAAPGVELVSPLRHALGPGVVDVSHVRKLELRGAVDTVEPAAGQELIRLGPARALLVGPGPAPEGVRSYDMSSALAAFEVTGEDVLRRLTALDFDRLPAAGALARGIRAIVQRRDGETFRIFVAQELGHYTVEVVLDTLRGLGR